MFQILVRLQRLSNSRMKIFLLRFKVRSHRLLYVCKRCYEKDSVQQHGIMEYFVLQTCSFSANKCSNLLNCQGYSFLASTQRVNQGSHGDSRKERSWHGVIEFTWIIWNFQKLTGFLIFKTTFWEWLDFWFLFWKMSSLFTAIKQSRYRWSLDVI